MALSREDARKLAHLMRRAGFGTRPKEWDDYAKLGVAGTTEILLHPERVPDHLKDVLEAIGGDYVDFDNRDSTRNWWLYRMVHTRRPLEEKMTLFWHNHFATADYKVNNSQWMWKQNETFRRHALGNFRTLMQAMTRDPAMLVWLDGRDNRNGKPNENFAREILELFSMGVGSGYTEKDIQEAARAFTGWRYDDRVKSFIYDPHLHDDGAKTIFGQTGNFHGDEVIDIICRQPQTARFLATKLWKYFAHDNPTAAELAPLEQAYFKSGFDMREVMKVLLTSPGFYSPAAFYSKIKSPVEFAVLTMRTMDAPLTLANGIGNAVERMGQDLFNPPNVKGWLEGKDWINTRTLLARVNFASNVAYEAQRRGILPQLIRTGLLGQSTWTPTPEGAIDALWQALMPGRDMHPKTRAALLKYVLEGLSAEDAAMSGSMSSMGAMSGAMGGSMEKSMGGQEAMSGAMSAKGDSKLPALKSTSVEVPPKVRRQVEAKLPGLLNLILSAPEYQLA